LGFEHQYHPSISCFYVQLIHLCVIKNIRITFHYLWRNSLNKEIISSKIRDQLILQAREFRKHPTHAEALLWEQLRKHRLCGIKFRRQHIIHHFIVDFYCPAAKLIIEIDGPVHNSRIEYDIEREEHIRDLGCHIIRFPNREVLQDIDLVIAGIYDACMRRIESIKANSKNKDK
jgi:very-short-patch-repair endonuclease